MRSAAGGVTCSTHRRPEAVGASAKPVRTRAHRTAPDLIRVFTEAEAYDGKLVRAGLVDARAGAASLGLDPDEVERMLA